MKYLIFACIAIFVIARFMTLNAQEKDHHGRPPIPSPEELKKLPPDGGPNWNRLVFESSPYLLQHASNPVDWRPWSEDSFKAAREKNMPIFLSIGYATCHWCHVMERESFEDPEVAAMLNENFICIKVDREERPDVDEIYMAACQAMTGSGGWPLNVLLDDKLRPFYAGTYFPKRGNANRPGMMDFIPKLAELYRTSRADVENQAVTLTRHLQEISATSPGASIPGKEALDSAYQQLSQRFDAENGGFGSAPKFPTPHNITALLRQWKRTGDQKALDMVVKTLTAMRWGGIYDQVGFGFHRYSTDARWLLPHFEKMLYDQALLTIAYTEAYQATGDPLFKDTAKEIIAYVLRDMTSPEGGFYSAEDADSEGAEGKFYIWRKAQVMEILGAEDGALYSKVFNLGDTGNFRSQVPGEIHMVGQNIPHLKQAIPQIAIEMKMDEKTLRARLETCREKLFQVREKRSHPFKDDKILTDWNGLMIAALARAASVFHEPSYAQAAEKAANFILKTLRTPEGRLLKRYRAGNAGLPAHIDDYAFLSWGLLELYEATFNTIYLQEAITLTTDSVNHFWDGENGGFYFTANDGESLIVRTKSLYDGAIPSGNSVSALNLVKLGRITTTSLYEEKAEELLKAFSTQIARGSSSFSFLLQAISFMQGPSYEVVIVGKPEAEDTKAMTNALFAPFQPNKVVVFRPKKGGDIVTFAPYTESQKMKDGKATAYVCQNYACKLPTTDVKVMLKNFGN